MLNDPILSFRGKYVWLSNMFKMEIRVDGEVYPSAEHAYMSFKSNDPEWKAKCKDSSISPGKIKTLSRKIELVDDWELIKIDVMRRVLEAKFNVPAAMYALAETGDAYIMEGNDWHDTFWGVDVSSGVGQNHLGRLLMEIRTNIQSMLDGEVQDDIIGP